MVFLVAAYVIGYLIVGCLLAGLSVGLGWLDEEDCLPLVLFWPLVVICCAIFGCALGPFGLGKWVGSRLK